MFLKKGRKLKRFSIGSNQYRKRSKTSEQNGVLLISFYIVFALTLFGAYVYKSNNEDFISPYVSQADAQVIVIEKKEEQTELQEIVSYITKVFEPEGKDVVVKAINCFYSESGLRKDAVGQNTDGPRSKDHGIAQLNDYWHKLTDAQKTEIKANIDKAYEIYKGRGGNFSAWYGKGCK